jgi:hypothetical protein
MTGRWESESHHCDARSKGRALLDPYLRWLHASQARGLAQWHELSGEQLDAFRLQILAWIEDPAGLDALIDGHVAGVSVPPVYRQPVAAGAARSHFFTAHLEGGVAFDWLRENPLDLHWKVAMPLRDAQRAAQASPKGRYGPTRDQTEMQARNLVQEAFAATDAQGQPLKPLDRPDKVQGLIAVIDFGCPFLNDRFADLDATRIVGVWDQGQEPRRSSQKRSPPKGWPWLQPKDFSYGRELGPEALTRLRRFARQPGAPEETLIYRGLDYLVAYDDARRRVWYATHGGMVLDLAGGAPDPLNPQARDDHASAAKLLFVDLPTLTAADSAGGSLGAHVLDGVRYALAAADEQHPVVVVISYGNGAGPHNGSSLIERALDELIQLRGDHRLAIVLAAGNARLDGGHVRRTVAWQRSAMLRLQVAAGDTTDTFVELWYPKEGSTLELRVRSPGLVWSPWIAQGEEILMRSAERSGEFVAMIRHDREVPNGDRAMALLALAPTAQPPGVPGALADAGLWEIEVRLTEGQKEAVVVDAWIERDDPVRGSRAERTRFIDRDDTDEHHTLSGMATGKFTYKAAGFNRATGRPAPYSSLPAPEQRGAAGDPRLVLAACEEDPLQPTVAAAATRSVDVYRMNGTSVAAPVLARRLYNAMVESGRSARPPPRSRDPWPQAPAAPAALQAALERAADAVKGFESD